MKAYATKFTRGFKLVSGPNYVSTIEVGNSNTQKTAFLMMFIIPNNGNISPSTKIGEHHLLPGHWLTLRLSRFLENNTRIHIKISGVNNGITAYLI